MGRPYRISGDPYEGEVMSVHHENDGTYYVEIPELGWNDSGYETPQEAARCALEIARGAIENAEEAFDLSKMHSQVEEAKVQMDIAKKNLAHFKKEWRKKEERLQYVQSAWNAKELSEGLKELPEDEPRVMRAMKMFFGEDSSYPAEAVAFKLYRDVDGDGDMDHAFVAWSRRKKLVK